MLCESVKELDDREREYLSYRFGLEDGVHHTRKESAEHFHLKEVRAKQIEKSAMKNIRKHFEPQWNYINNYVPPDPKDKEWLITF